jgi:hypothetical protein
MHALKKKGLSFIEVFGPIVYDLKESSTTFVPES